MNGGYTGKLLFVDLSSGTYRDKALDPKDARQYLGGYGLGCKVLYDMVPPGSEVTVVD